MLNTAFVQFTEHVKKIAIEGWEWDTDPYIFNSSEVHPFSLPE
jgi:hypothetical protein